MSKNRWYKIGETIGKVIIIAVVFGWISAAAIVIVHFVIKYW